jgi:hypothetical protein
MKTPKLTEAQVDWFVAELDGIADELRARAKAIDAQLVRHPNGRVRVALHPRMVALKAMAEWLPDAGRAALRGES